MRILSRYLLKAAAGPFLFSLGVLTGLLMINTVARRIEDLAGKGLPPDVIVEVFALSLPHVLALTLPMAVLVAVLHAFSQLASDNEVTALKASGVNLARLTMPLLAAAVVLAGIMLWFNDDLLPDTNHRLKNLLIDVSRKSPTLQLKERVINPIPSSDYRTRYYLQAAEVDPATNVLTDVVIWDLSNPEQVRTIYADSGQMAFNQQQTDLFLTLHSGHINELEEGVPERFQRVFFDRQIIRMRDVGNVLERSQGDQYRGEREMGFAMLAGQADERQAEIAELGEEARELAAAALQAALAGDTDGAIDAATAVRRAGRAAPEPGQVTPADLEPTAQPSPPLETEAIGDRAGVPIPEPTAQAISVLPDESASAPAAGAPRPVDDVPDDVDADDPARRLAAARNRALERRAETSASTAETPPLPPRTRPRPDEQAGRPGATSGGRTAAAAEPVARPSAPLISGISGSLRGQLRGSHDLQTIAARAELESLASRARTKQLQMNSYEVEYQKKLAIPFACVVFVLIGAPLAVRFPRGGIGMVIAISLGVFAIYYVGLIGGEKLADTGMVDPFWSMWAPNAIFLLLGLWGMSRIGHEAGTSRGGGWDDLVYSVRTLLARPLRALRTRRAGTDDATAQA